MDEIKVPQMGESISEATIGKILKASGSIVSMDDEILELETDKVNQVIYAQSGGKLQLTVKEGDTVAIGDTIGTIDTAIVSPNPTPAAPLATAPKKEEKKELAKEVVQKTPAKEEPKVESDARETRKKMPRIRQVIASRLLESVKTTAMLTTFNEVDMSRILEIRENNKDKFQEKHGVKLGFMSFFVKACVSALKAFPEFNTYIDGDEFVQRNYIDIGVAIGTDRGLVVPVLRECDKLSFADIERGIGKFAEKARSGQLGADDLVGGSFTISNGGTYGSMLSTPILNPPQCGILGMHKIQKRAVVIDDQIVIRPIMYLALSYDHRVVDGKEAVSFLVHIKNELEDPSKLILDI